MLKPTLVACLVTATLIVVPEVSRGELVSINATGPDIQLTAVFDTDAPQVDFIGTTFSQFASSGLVSLEAVSGGTTRTYDPAEDFALIYQRVSAPGATQLEVNIGRSLDTLLLVLDTSDSATAFIANLLFDSTDQLLSGVADHLPVDIDNFSPFEATRANFVLNNVAGPNLAFTNISISIVPEPCSALLAGAGLLVAAIRRRGRLLL